MKQTLTLLILLSVYTASFAQSGYIYVHLRNVNEESTPSPGISFNLSGATTAPPVTSFTLNDQPAIVNYMYDIGASHGTSTVGGDGELWVVTKSGWQAAGSGAIFRRKPNSATWESIGQQGSAVDGAGINQCVFINGGNAYFYNAGTLSTIWTSTLHLGVTAVDIAYGGGEIAIVGSDGGIYKNNFLTAYIDVWTKIVTAVNAQRVDILPSNLNIVMTNSTGSVYTYNSSGIQLSNPGNPVSGNTKANYDIAYTDDGTIFAVNTDRNSYYYNGSTWTNDPSGQNLLNITGGLVKQVWASTQWNYSYMQQALYTRTNYGLSNSTTSTFATSSTPVWIDDERVRTIYNDNSIIIPVTAGSYTLSETVPSGWDIQGIDCYDPTSNSSGNIVTNSVSINVSAGEVVHVVLRNEKLVPISMLKACSSNQLVENFDTVTSPMPVTSYHWSSTVRTDDGRYSVGTTSTGWPHATLTDHTSGTGKYMMVNASFQPDEFYRKRMINLVQGANYQISFWVINLSPGISPDIRFGINDSNGVVLQSISTGSIADDQVWHNYVLTFTSTTGTADVFLQNNAPGGGGNDVGIDDIALSPLATPISSMSISPVPLPNLCIGTAYTFSVSPSGGTWSSSVRSVASINPNTGSVTARTAGTSVISYHYTNAIGCATDTTTQVTVSAPPTVVATLKYAGTIFKGGTVCKGSVDSLLSSPSGGTAPYTYLWSASPSNSAAGLGATTIQNTTATPTTAGTYVDTITVTDAVGCTASDTTLMIVSNNTQPVITLNSAGTNCTNTSVTLTTLFTTNGTSPYTYAYTASPSSGAGLVNANAVSTTASPTVAGTYTYTVNLTDNAKCMAQATKVITVNPSPSISAAYSPAAVGGVVTICKNGSLNLTSSPSGGTIPYTYAWTGTGAGAGTITNSTSQNTAAKPVAGAANYTVTLTDTKGCTASASTGNITVSVNSAANAPTVSASATLASPCANASSTAIALGGSASGGAGSYTYQWTGPASNTIASSTSASTTAVAATSGNFNLTVTDRVGCSATASTNNLTVNSLPVVTAASTFLALCRNDNTTSLSATASGGSGSGYTSWSWTSSPSNGGIVSASSQTTNATPGTYNPTTTYTYSVTVKDGNGCTSLPGSVTVISSNNNNPATTVSPATGSKICGTSISLGNTPTGGAGSYTYAWTGTGLNDTTLKSPTATPGATGTYIYKVVVRDGNLCQATASTTMTLNNAVTVSPVASNPSFCKGSATSLTLYSNPAGGNGTYTYSWSGTPSGNGLSATTTTKNITAAPTGSIGSSYTYSVTVTDGNSCTATGNVSIIKVVATPSISAVASASAYCINQPITLTSSPSGGLAPYTYAWTAPTDATITDPTAQNTITSPGAANNYAFTVTVLDDNNCTASGTTSIVTINSLPTVTVASSSYSVCAAPTQTITLTAIPANGAAPYTGYQWTGNNLTAATTNTGSNTARPTTAGIYSVRVTDNNGCISAAGSTSNVAIDQGTPSVTLTCGTNSNGIRYGQFYETNGTSWKWTSISGGRFYTSSSLSVTNDSDVSTLQAPFIVQRGDYKVSITNIAGCQGSFTYSVTPTSCGQVLASSLLSFTATAQNSQAVLSWDSKSDNSVKSFLIERSSDGASFEQIGTVNNDGRQKFIFTDAMPIAGTNYYRLKLVEINNVSYSLVRSVKFDAGVWIVKLYPVPARSFINIELNNDKEEKAVIIMHTTTGQQVFAQNQLLQKGFNHIILSNLSNLAEGSYFITLQTADRVYRNKFIKGKY